MGAKNYHCIMFSKGWSVLSSCLEKHQEENKIVERWCR